MKAGPGDDVDEAEELDRVVPVVDRLRATLRPAHEYRHVARAVAQAGFAEGACVGNDISGFADPDYLTVAAPPARPWSRRISVFAPRVADPAPALRRRHRDRASTSCRAAPTGPRRRRRAGPGSILDAGLDLGKTAAQSLQLLRDSATDSPASAAPLLLSASNKTFLGVMFDLPVADRREPSLAATALGIAAGCRIVRVHDVAGTVRVRDVIARSSKTA